VAIASRRCAGVALFRCLIRGSLFAAVAGLIVKGIVTAGTTLLAAGKAFGFLCKEQREAIESGYEYNSMDCGCRDGGLT